jgi:predicted dehydrogenase
MIETSRRDLLLGLGATAALTACADTSTSTRRKLGIAVAGVGSVAEGQVIPAIAGSSQCKLAGLVDIDLERLSAVGRKFSLPDKALYTQQDFDRIAHDPEVDVVYIAVPNALHAEYAIRAARAGKHVLVEKPMATTEAECLAMTEACRAANRQLAVAYRLHHSPHHQAMLSSTRDGALGPVDLIRADIGYPLEGGGGWRTRRALAGGGALLEQGVYCVNAACSLAGEEPVEVNGVELKSDPSRFGEVDETVIWNMRFASGAIAQCSASYTMAKRNIWVGSHAGWFSLDEPFSFDEIQATTSDGPKKIPQVNQFELQINHFCSLVRSGRRPPPGISAADGLRDVRIISAVYESVRSGAPVALTRT